MTTKVKPDRFILLWFLLAMTAGAYGEPRKVERVTWDGTPVPVVLPVGIERLVTFSAAVRVGVPSDIQGVLRTQSAGGTVYWLASEAFDTRRVQIQDVETGAMFMIDLSAVENDSAARSTPIEIVTAAPETAAAPEPGDDEPAQPDYVTLTRFAAQQLYAPKRLLSTPPGVHRAPVPRVAAPLVRGAQVEAVPVAAWRGGRLHVTAVRLRNLGPDPVVLDPRNLRGRWRTAAFQHVRLHPTGSESDTTAVYLISTRPFEESL